MNVASLELCKELYELSGWAPPDSDEIYGWDNEQLKTKKIVGYEYDLGYLLRKLQPLEPMLSTLGEGWECSALDVGRWEANVRELTPEDAACKLAIELFKQGVLEKAS